MSGDSIQVRFVVAPFLPEHQPALGVSTMLSLLQQNGIRADVQYLNVQFMRQIGWELYYYLSYATPPEILAGEMAFLPASPDLLLGEMVFAPALWGDAASNWEEYADRLTPLLEVKQHTEGASSGGGARREQALHWGRARELIRALREDSPRIVKQWAQEILRDNPRVIGFTSTFQQSLASLALAKELRRLRPREELTLIMGGANCEADMGKALADNFPFMDHVVSGEGEGVILSLVQNVLEKSGGRPQPRYVAAPQIENMDSLPMPDFDHYFAAIKDMPMAKRANLTAESSRGCWWGAKAHCTFCGLNGSGMAYRSKDPGRFVQEMRTLSRKYGFNFFMMADNILDLKYIKSVFPALITQGDELTMFYETKSNLRKDQLELMVAGGVTELQPGIESLSTAVLELMDKGTTRLQNIQLIKWCEEFAINVNWNILFGFPGELPSEYAAMAELMPSLFHLPPPGGAGKIRLDRFAPYWKSPEKYKLKNVRQKWSYDYVYAQLPPEERRRIAYYFDYDHEDERDPTVYLQDTLKRTEQWRDGYSRGVTLELKTEGSKTFILDSRDGASRETPLTADGLRLLKFMDSIQSSRSALAHVNEGREGGPLSEADFDALLASFVERNWIISEGARYLSIVLDRGERQRIIDLKIAAQLGTIDWKSMGARPAVSPGPALATAGH
ncbi:RiPP maturation radical SAM protein 1 [Corallococcus sp. H22C18031201]|uniref:RiPP maturation radical SAM C-methyltransferase n=1 Tax=Citreicoccus inhibens TaxID=2849499 RepID=UPI000E70BE75|nr:RiPP maturation radical SAM C-methyltransferase [Citreicoccus inhibens]MBU8897888.1 RiPP maturation radical SAM C-methyltransferase [Citreicoccus inhibens]RJS17005.1 RiPP maturation radical SAM protein 1 [Corallococcus sp. H22C18031201]